MATPKSFPEPVHTKHIPDGEGSAPSYIRNSENTDCGHESHDDRMPHPFRDSFAPNSESGEGLNE